MGLPPSCFYPLQAFRTGGAQALAQTMENFFRSGWDPLVLGGVDGSNAHPNLAGGGLSWSGAGGSSGGGPYPPKPSPPPHLPAPWAKRLVVELADETADARIRKKGAPGTPENRKPGLEFIVDASDTTYGKVCFVAKQDLSKQIGSVILENPATVTNPKVDFFANCGKMRVGTSGAFALELIRNGSTITVEERTGSAAITYDIKTVKFSNGTVARTLDTGAYTLNGLADTFYSMAYDLKTSGLLSGYTATASSTYTFDLASFTSNTVAALLATAINDIQTNGYLSVSLYRCTTPRTRNALDCDSFTLNQLGQALCAFLAELGVSGLEIGLADKQPLDADLTAIAALTTDTFGRSLLTKTTAAAARTTLAAAKDYDSWNVTATSGGLYEFLENGEPVPSTVFVDMSALTGSQDFGIDLPPAADYTDQRFTIKISVPPGTPASQTLTVDADGGNVEGAATEVLDGSGRTKATYQSDGTNWHKVA